MSPMRVPDACKMGKANAHVRKRRIPTQHQVQPGAVAKLHIRSLLSPKTGLSAGVQWIRWSLNWRPSMMS